MKQQSKDRKDFTIRSNGDHPAIVIEHFHVAICASLGELFRGAFFVGIGLVGNDGSVAVLEDLRLRVFLGGIGGDLLIHLI